MSSLPAWCKPSQCEAKGAGDQNGLKKVLLHAPAEGFSCTTCLVNRLSLGYRRSAGDLAAFFSEHHGD